jgi:hypothetical protein
MDNDTEKMVDLKNVEAVEVLIDDGKLWVNIDGKCRLRAYGFDHIEVIKMRPQSTDQSR